jgi:putative tricarboxylic transport membrane protein
MARSIAAPAGVIVLSLVLLWQTAGMHSAYSADELFGPAVFPRVVLGGLVFVSVLQIAQELVRRPAAAAGTQRFRLDIRAFAVTLAAAVAYVFAMGYVGFLPATLAFQSVIFVAVFGMRSAAGMVLLPAVLTGIYFIIFLRLLELPLPQGYGPFRELSRFIYY